MSGTGAPQRPGSHPYSLGHTPGEYERLREQARQWEAMTARILDQLRLPPGASCLDAGSGPGETMRLLAQRVGPAGRVIGIDIDPPIGALAVEMLHRGGHRQCAFRLHDLTADEPVPGAPYDVVHARLLLFHLPQRATVLGRLWEAVAPGGHLVAQDYDTRTFGLLPDLPGFAEVKRVILAAFSASGADLAAGARLPQLFVQAGVGVPDGTEVSGRIEPLGAGGRILAENTFRSLLPTALERAITTEDAALAALAALDREAAGFADAPVMWPLMIGAWKRKELK